VPVEATCPTVVAPTTGEEIGPSQRWAREMIRTRYIQFRSFQRLFGRTGAIFGLVWGCEVAVGTAT
jgi:hypothetical protein